jgi:hypothetical protein
MRSFFIRIALFLALVPVISACDDVLVDINTSSGRIRLELRGDHFVLDSRTNAVTVPFVVTNNGSTVFLARCGDWLSTEVERWTGGNWVNASAAICPATADMSPVVLPSREAQSAATVVRAKGVYRFRVGFADTPGQLPRWDLISETFVVE